MYITEKDIQVKTNENYEEIILPEGDRAWIGGINGVFYSISRGVPVKVPANLAALIRQNENCTLISSESFTEYETPQGKKIGGKRK